MSPTEAETITQRYFEEIFNQGNLAAIVELLSPDILFENPPIKVAGQAEFRQLVLALRHAFPDLHFDVQETMVAGSKVVSRWVLQGTQQGEFQGHPPTHRQFAVTGIDIFQIEGS